MLKKYNLTLLIILVFCLNGLIYLRATFTIDDFHLVFVECARNSGRTSAALNLIVLFMLGYFGLKEVYKDQYKKRMFRVLISLFAVNHLVHFFFVSQHFKIQVMDLNILDNIHGFITFVFVFVAPIVLWANKRLTKVLYFSIILHLFNVTYFISDTFYSRYKPEDPAYLHRIGIVIMIGALVYILYRMFCERHVKFEKK